MKVVSFLWLVSLITAVIWLLCTKTNDTFWKVFAGTLVLALAYFLTLLSIGTLIR